ncbi:MAG: protein kinase [Bacteroidetes bacterium]|nr:protein kinase [Bacteroidota bacterium]
MKTKNNKDIKMTLQPNIQFANRYKLKENLGIGGFSEVWLAEDTKSGNMPVALKIFAAGTGLNSAGLAEFSKEYSLVFNLNHPHLLKPTYYEDWNGMPFLVMQYMPNGSCTKLCGKLSEKELAKFILQICDALHYLHSQEPPIIHQDIKPDNVLIDIQGNYLLTDFGISTKIRKTLSKSKGNQSQSNGTTAYMAPERFSKKLEERSPIIANDIFSLGVTIFELLTDELPYGDHGGVIAASGLDPAELPATYSQSLHQLTAFCLAKDTWQRPNAEEIIAAAESYQKSGIWLLSERLSKQVKDTSTEHTPIPPRKTEIIVTPQEKERSKSKPKFPIGWLVAGILTISMIILLFIWQPWKSNAGVQPIVQQENPVSEDQSNDKKAEEQLKEQQENNKPTLKIGDNYAGGIIFYLDASGKHGLVCAPKDQGKYVWGCYEKEIGGTSKSFGSGAANTRQIANNCESNTAAGLCYNLNLNGYDDWFLPSKDELNLMYKNLHKNGIGGFSTNFYWSSSEHNAYYAWLQNFINGYQGYYNKDNSYYVRCVRSF